MGTVEFVGIPSWDGESFCWDVDVETFERVVGGPPDATEASRFRPSLYRLYPRWVMSGQRPRGTPVRIRVTVEPA